MKKVFTNGCFDILHRGHIELFKYAKSLGDILYVAVDGDSKVMNDKGLSRPINKLEDRVAILESIKYIDTVYRFHTTEGLENLVCAVQPDFLVVGSDWKGKEVVGKQYTKEVNYFDRIDGYSTSRIIQSIVNW